MKAAAAKGLRIAAKYLKQPSTQHGLNIMAAVAAAKFGIPLDTVLGAGALVSSAIMIAQDETKGESK